jgi:ribose/xylose/arabinose/galactoside ABC-type transport system permease subunit
MEVGILALPMTLVIAGEIDLGESMAGLSSAVLGFLWAAGVPICSVSWSSSWVCSAA